jgi:hypothetical protein
MRWPGERFRPAHQQRRSGGSCPVGVAAVNTARRDNELIGWRERSIFRRPRWLAVRSNRTAVFPAAEDASFEDVFFFAKDKLADLQISRLLFYSRPEKQLRPNVIG